MPNNGRPMSKEGAGDQHRRIRSHAYTFGDSDPEGRRLELVHEVFCPASAALLRRVVARPVALSYDLGCGTGNTTRLVASITKATTTVGLDTSESHLTRARARVTPGLRYVCHDITQFPFPAGPADLIFARLLLAHLVQPAAIARSWATQLCAGGTLVVDEIEWIRTEQPILAAHLELVTALVAATGARMCAGPLLWALANTPELDRLLTEVVEVRVPTALAAEMFAISLATWGDQAVVQHLCTEGHRRRLARGLTRLSTSTEIGEITWGLHQAAYRRRGVPR